MTTMYCILKVGCSMDRCFCSVLIQVCSCKCQLPEYSVTDAASDGRLSGVPSVRAIEMDLLAGIVCSLTISVHDGML